MCCLNLRNMSKHNVDKKPAICRVCLEASHKMYPLKGQILNVDVDVAAMISYCTSIEVQLSKDLPKGVCVSCFRTIRIAYNFIRQFKDSNKILLNEQKLSKNIQDDIVRNDHIVKIECYDVTTEQEEEIFVKYTDDSYDNFDDASVEYKISEQEDTEHDTCEDADEKYYVKYVTSENLAKYEVAQDKMSEYDVIEEKLSDYEITDGKQSEYNIPEEKQIEYFAEEQQAEGKELSIKKRKHIDTTPIVIPADADLIMQHKQTTKRKVYLKEHKCPLCACSFVDFETKLVTHLYAHNVVEVQCKLCSEVLSMDNFVIHYRQIHKFQCDICSRHFTSRTTFSYHLKTHTDGETYLCPFDNCSKSFTSSWCLKKHLNVHSGAVKYICSKCGAKFVTYDTFRYHLKTHDGKRNFLCTECGQTFLQAIHLKYHSYRHLGIKRFKCDTCDKRYTSVGALKKHKRRTLCGMEIKVEENELDSS